MRINRSLLNWGVFLIAIGGVPLAVQQGWVDSSIAGDLLRLWPLILVGVGLGLILRWTPLEWLGGALVAGTIGLLLGAVIAGGITGIGSACLGADDGTSTTTQRNGVSSGSTFDLDLELTCGELDVARAPGAAWSVEVAHAPDDPPTIEGSPSGLSMHQGDSGTTVFLFTQDARTQWDVEVPTTAAIAASVTLNFSDAVIDLGGGPLAMLSGTLNGASADIQLEGASTPQPAGLSLTLNGSSGSLGLPDGSIAGSITLNASSLDVCVPIDAELRIELESTLGSDDIGSSGLGKVGDGWQTVGYGTAAERIDLSITSNASSLSLERAEVCS